MNKHPDHIRLTCEYLTERIHTDDRILYITLRVIVINTTEASMRDRLVFLMQDMILLRGKSTRKMDLTDLFTLDLKDKGYSEYPALVLLMHKGKTNHTSRIEYSAAIRHKDYKVCAFSALAIYYFYRWQLMGEPFPNLQQNEFWFDIKVLKGSKSLTEEMDYLNQYKSVCKAFDVCDINSIKKTHAGRSCSTRHAEIAGASEDQLRRNGRWNAQSMESNYLTNLFRQSIRVINGFPATGGQFWLPKASVISRESLQKKVFPMVDSILCKVETGYIDTDRNNIPNSTLQFPRTICGQGFLLLLKKLRVIFLQDAVFLKVDYPQHPLFHNSIFRDPEYLGFEECLLTTCRDQDSHQEMKLKEVVPEIEQVLTNINTKMDTITSLISSMDRRPASQLFDESNSLAEALNGSSSYTALVLSSKTAPVSPTLSLKTACSSPIGSPVASPVISPVRTLACSCFANFADDDSDVEPLYSLT